MCENFISTRVNHTFYSDNMDYVLLYILFIWIEFEFQGIDLTTLQYTLSKHVVNVVEKQMTLKCCVISSHFAKEKIFEFIKLVLVAESI